MKSHKLVAARLTALVRAAVSRYGDQLNAANVLGLSQSHISRIVNKTGSPSYVHERTLMTVCSSMRIDASTFEDYPELAPSEWAERILDSLEKRAVPSSRSSFDEVLKLSEEIAKLGVLTKPEQARALARMILADGLVRLAELVSTTPSDDVAAAVGRNLAEGILLRHRRT